MEMYQAIFLIFLFINNAGPDYNDYKSYIGPDWVCKYGKPANGERQQHLLRLKFLGNRIPYTNNSITTFQLDILAFGDISPNPGPDGTDGAIDTHIHRPKLVYSSDQLLALNPYNGTIRSLPHLSTGVWKTITSLHINNCAKPRGKRGGRRKPWLFKKTNCDNILLPQAIPVHVNPRKLNKTIEHNHNFIDHSNLIPITCSSPLRNLTFHLWNATSIRNKTVALLDHILTYDVDVMLIVETWLIESDSVIVGECTPPGYEFFNYIRGSPNYGGGIGIIAKKSLKLSPSPTTVSSVTFEHCTVTLKNLIKIIGIYRPPPSPVNKFKTSDFLEEIDLFLDKALDTPLKTIIVGDFNIHMDEPERWDTKRFTLTIDNLGITQHVKHPTHTSGHIIDLVLTGEGDDLVCDIPEVEPFDETRHFLVKFTISCSKPHPLKVKKTSREFGKMNHARFTEVLKDKLGASPDSSDPNTLVELYNRLTLSTLNELCPLVTKEVVLKHKLPWYNNAIHAARQERRRLERKWKKSRSSEDENCLREQKKLVSKLIIASKTEFFSEKCVSSNTKEMFRTVNGLLNKPSRILPDCDLNNELANKFLTFFIEKVETIRNNVGYQSASDQTDHFRLNSVTPPCFTDFRPLSCDDIVKIIAGFPSKQCILDPIPTWLIKENLHLLAPLITKIVNNSLSMGIFPSTLKQSIITPVIKKSTLDRNILKSYRPIANLPFLSKVIEKAASCQVMDHVDSNALGEILQSSYKRHHSTETALLKVKNDLLLSLDNDKAVLMVLLDMSAAFDTVDHDIMLQRLTTSFGIHGSVKSWFRTYLKDRITKVCIDGDFSAEHTLKYSLPQGSIIGPHGFILYTSPVGDIIRSFNISFHAYADDVQMYAEFNPKIEGDCERVLANLTSCINRINAWMVQNTLRLNQDKTEFFLVASRNVSSAFSDLELNLGDCTIRRSLSIKNLGVTFDDVINMSGHINSICKTVNFHIRNIWRIRRFITMEACHHVVRGLVLSRLDYANSLLVGARQADINRLQRLQNKAARLVMACGRDQPSSDLLADLHWLPVRQRISYKLLLYVFKSLSGQAPVYMSALIQLLNSPSNERRHRLRSSSDQTRLIVNRSKKRAGDNSFTVAAARLWNELPIHIREALSVSVFKQKLKTHLFP